MDGDAPSGTPPEGKQKKPRSRGARLSKAEREARRDARQAAASADEQHGEAFETRRAALLGHAAAGEWDAAATLGGASVPLALELFGQLLPRGSPRQIVHFAARVAKTVPVEALAALVQQTADGGAPEKAAALARGLGLGMGPDAPDGAAALVDLPALVLAALEARGLDGGVRELLVGDGALQLATLRRMLAQSRGLAHAAHFLPALQQLAPPGDAACARLGAQAEVLLRLPQHGGGGGAAAAAAAAAAAEVAAAAAAAEAEATAVRRAEAVRALVAEAVRAVWADGSVLLYGSALLRTAHAQSDVDLCAIVPQHARAHPRNVQGRAQLLPLLQAAEKQLRGCPQVSSLEFVAESKTPLLSFTCDTGSGGLAAVELTFNNSDAVANSYVYGALLARAPPLRLSCRFVRVWARRQKLCGPQGTPSAWTWSVLAAYAAQHFGLLPLVAPDSESFVALVDSPAAAAAAAAATPAAAAAAPAAAAAAPAAAAAATPAAATTAAASPPSTATLEERWRLLGAASLGSAPVGASIGSLAHGLQRASVASPTAACPSSTTSASAAASTAAAAAGDGAASGGALLWHTFMLLASGVPYRRRVVSLRDVEMSKAGKGWKRRNEGALMVEDPVEISRDLGRVVSCAALHAMRIAAARAALAIFDGGGGGGGGGGEAGGAEGGGPLAALLRRCDWRLEEQTLGRSSRRGGREGGGRGGRGRGEGRGGRGHGRGDGRGKREREVYDAADAADAAADDGQEGADEVGGGGAGGGKRPRTMSVEAIRRRMEEEWSEEEWDDDSEDEGEQGFHELEAGRE